MKLQTNIKHDICALFQVSETENGGWCVVTPLQYAGLNDFVVVNVDPVPSGWKIHDAGFATLNANLAGHDTHTDAVARWASELERHSPARYDEDEEWVNADVADERLLAPYVIRVAEASQQLFTISTQRQERRKSNFKNELADVILDVSAKLNKNVEQDVILPIAGGLAADFVIDHDEPLIVVAATSVTRLMEAEIIFMQYRHQKMPGFVLAIAENAHSVGRAQFERANYYTGKTVSFDARNLSELVKEQLQ